MKEPLHSDTICALATPAGGAIGIIRVSGPEAISLTDRTFRGRHKLSDTPTQCLRYGEVLADDGSVIDDVVIGIWRAPHSYTGEDCVDINCHGSRYILQQVLQRLISLGARQAHPGEYTQRAYLNGKMDLSQAEAVADLVAATNSATHQLAISQLRGHFSSELARLRERLLKMTSLLELELDFSDHEDLEFASRPELTQLAQEIDDRVQRLAHSFAAGKAMKEGIPVAIVGRTNVGKSTLLNRLLHEDRAIVSDIHGTTRDVIEDTTEIHGVTFRFIDTAGIRETDDTVERLGIERTYQKISEASIILWIIDALPSPDEVADMKRRCEGRKLMIVWNKADINQVPETLATDLKSDLSSDDVASHTLLSISAKENIGIDDLRTQLYQLADLPDLSENDVIVTNARHYDALCRAHDDLLRVLDGLHAQLSGDLIAEDLRACLDDLADITGGKITPQDTLNNIFSHFCIGK